MKQVEGLPLWEYEEHEVTSEMLSEQFGFIFEINKNNPEELDVLRKNYIATHPIEFTEEEITEYVDDYCKNEIAAERERLLNLK